MDTLCIRIDNTIAVDHRNILEIFKIGYPHLKFYIDDDCLFITAENLGSQTSKYILKRELMGFLKAIQLRDTFN